MKTLKTTTLIIWLILIATFNANAQNWQWIKHIKGNSSEDVTSICTDFNGNVYIIGEYSFLYMTAPAASISFDSITLPPNGDNQLFVAKYSSAGNILWAKSIGGNNVIGNSDIYEYANSISYDPLNQCIYVTGNIYGTVPFGSTTLSGYGVSFYTKMDLNGNYIWAKQFPFIQIGRAHV